MVTAEQLPHTKIGDRRNHDNNLYPNSHNAYEQKSISHAVALTENNQSSQNNKINMEARTRFALVYKVLQTFA